MTGFKREADFKTREWGLSMYGGWYINYFNGGEFSGVGGKTLKECLEQLGITKADLKKHNRWDN